MFEIFVSFVLLPDMQAMFDNVCTIENITNKQEFKHVASDQTLDACLKKNLLMAKLKDLCFYQKYVSSLKRLIGILYLKVLSQPNYSQISANIVYISACGHSLELRQIVNVTKLGLLH